MSSDDDEYLRGPSKSAIAVTREQQIDDWIDWDGGDRSKGRHGKWFQRIAKRLASETVEGYERRVGHEATLLLYPAERERWGGLRLSQRAFNKPEQQDLWKAMMNLWMLQILRERNGVSDNLQAALKERDRLAAQCRQMWGPEPPDDRKPISDVLVGMWTRLEAVLDGKIAAHPTPVTPPSSSNV